MPTQKYVCEYQCIVDFNYSVVPDQLIPHIYTAPLFKIEYLNKMYRSRSDLANLSHANMICDASNANKTLVIVGRALRYILNI